MPDGSPASPMPVTRGDCANVPRPCPHHTCKWNLYHTGVYDNGGKFAGYTLSPDRTAADSCVLDMADEGPMNTTQIAKIFGVAPQRIRQILGSITKKLTKNNDQGSSLSEYAVYRGAAEAGDKNAFAYGCRQIPSMRYE